MSMDVTHLMDEKPNERDPFWFLMKVDGPAEASLGAPPAGAAGATSESNDDEGNSSAPCAEERAQPHP